MKKILSSIIVCMLSVIAFAQTQTNIDSKTCFCCGDFYQIIPPVISGPSVANCGTTVKFTWPNNCPGVVVGRNFSPFPPGAVGGGDNVSAYLNIPAGYTGTITLTVSFICGNKTVTSQKVFKVECCDCSKLPQKPVITGPTCFCLSKPCDQTLTYSVPNYGDQSCYTYEWSIKNAVGGPVTIAGQGTNQMSFNCNSLQAGTYYITVTVKCGDKVVTNTIQLVVCNKPDPGFSMSSSGSDVTFTSLGTGTDYWYLVKDNDNNCAYTGGETYQFSSTNPATFSGLVNNQQYTVYHFVYKKCGNNCFCWSSKMMCFKWLPSQLMKTANGAKGVESLKERELLKIDEIPAEFRKELPKELWTGASERKD
jgi:hypothetical protein